MEMSDGNLCSKSPNFRYVHFAVLPLSVGDSVYVCTYVCKTTFLIILNTQSSCLPQHTATHTCPGALSMYMDSRNWQSGAQRKLNRANFKHVCMEGKLLLESVLPLLLL